MPGPDVPIDPVSAALQLLVGGSVEAVDALRGWLERARASPSGPLNDDRTRYEEGAGERAFYLSIALLFASYGVARRGLSRAADASGKVARVLSKALSPARKMLGPLAHRREADLERWIRVGQEDVARSASLARSVALTAVNQIAGLVSESRMVDGLVQKVAGSYLRHLQEHPGTLDGLVQELAGSYLSHLRDHPELLESLIRSQGDRYVEYLNQNPEMVQELVTGQSSGLANELIDGVRARAVTADGVFESIARSILHRPPRERLPGPSPAVRQRAERATLPSDLTLPGADDHAAG